jgi:MFS family permease
MSAGLLTAHVLGTFLSWKTTSIICGIFPILCFLQSLTIPETPSWLIKKNKLPEGEAYFQRLRGVSAKDSIEFQEMKNSALNNEPLEKSWFGKVWEDTRKREFLKPLGIISLAFFVMQSAGANAIAFYAVTIMKDMMGSTVDEYFAMIFYDTVRVVMSIVGCFLAKRLRRKTLAIYGGLVTGICSQLLAAFMYISRSYAPSWQEYSWVSLLFLIGFLTFFCSAVYPLPFILKG